MKYRMAFEADSMAELEEQLIDAASYFAGAKQDYKDLPDMAQLTVVTPTPAVDTDVRVAPFPPFTPAPEDDAWPVGICPSHHKPFREGKFGAYCSGQGGDGTLNAKGYCDLKHGSIYKGKRVIAA